MPWVPEKQREELTDYAKRITHLDRERDEFQGQSGYLPEEEYRRVERLENEIKEGIRKLTEAEEICSSLRFFRRKEKRPPDFSWGMEPMIFPSSRFFAPVMVCTAPRERSSQTIRQIMAAASSSPAFVPRS